MYDLNLHLKQMKFVGVAIINIKSNKICNFNAATLDDPVTQHWLHDTLSTHAPLHSTMHATSLQPMAIDEPMLSATTDLAAIQVQNSSPTPANVVTVKVEETHSKDTAPLAVTTPKHKTKLRSSAKGN